MNTVFKYSFDVNDYFTIEMPEDAKIISIQMQKSMPQLWALVDSDKPKKKRKFRLAGTGHQIKENINDLQFIDTFQVHGALVFHVFEIIESKSKSEIDD